MMVIGSAAQLRHSSVQLIIWFGQSWPTYPAVTIYMSGQCNYSRAAIDTVKNHIG